MACNCGQVRDIDNGKGNVKVGWVRFVDEYVSLLALEMGLGIGFGGVVSMFIMWEKARHWLIPPQRRPFYGMYKFHT